MDLRLRTGIVDLKSARFLESSTRHAFLSVDRRDSQQKQFSSFKVITKGKNILQNKLTFLHSESSICYWNNLDIQNEVLTP
jgi:hypothetical protein